MAFGTLPARVTAGTTDTSTVSITDNDDADLAPRNLMATSGLDRRIDLTWNAPLVSNIRSYEYRVSSDDGASWNPDWTSIPGSNPSTTAYTVRDLMNSVSYTIQVRAVLSDGQSPPATANAEPMGPPTRANTPTITDISAGDGSISVYWKANDNPRAPDTSYLVQYRRSGTSGWTTVTVDRNTDGYTVFNTEITGLSNQTHYEVRIAAVNRLGTSDYSDIVVATPQAPFVSPPGPIGEDALSVGTPGAYWTDQYQSDNVHPDVDPLSRNTIINGCSGVFPFTVLWTGPDGDNDSNRVAGQWAAHIQTERGAGRIVHAFATGEFSDRFTNLYGQASLQGFSIISIRVRGQFDGSWGTWSPQVNLLCLTPDMTAGDREEANQIISTQTSQQQQAAAPTVEFNNLPGSHDGDPFTIRLSFSREFPVTEQQVRNSLTVAGGSVETVARVTAGESRRWDITIAPSEDTVTVALANNPCPDENAICTEDNLSLETGIAAIISGTMPTRVLAAVITSDPGENGAWDAGETVTAEVTFNHQVQPYGPPGNPLPHLVIQLGDHRVAAPMTSTGGAATHTFSYTVTDDEDGAASARPATNGIVLNGTPFVSNTGDYPILCFDGHRRGNNAPARPAGLAATSDGQTVTLSWDDPGDARVTGYRVIRRDVENDPPGIFTEVVADTCSVGAEFTDREVGKGRQYSYRIQARNGERFSQRSGYVNVTVSAGDPVDEPVVNLPDAPTGLASGAVSRTSVTLSWDDPGDDSVTGYRVLRQDLDGSDPDALNTIADDTGSAATSYSDTTVEANQRYSYRVAALNENGASEQSDALNVETPPDPPARPTGLSASGVAHNSVTLSWDDPGDGSITGYRVLRQDLDGSDPQALNTVAEDTGSPATSYTDGTVTPETRYAYRVLALNATGESPQSSYVNVETPEAPANDPPPQTDPPGRPTGLQAASVSHDSVTLNWDDPGDATITGYRILRRDVVSDPPGTFSTVAADTGSAATSYTDTTVSAETRYAYRVVALNANGASPRSGYVNAETPEEPANNPPPQTDPPGRPTGLQAASVSHDSVTLNWDDPGDATITGYRILRRDVVNDPPGTFSTVVDNTGTAATSYTDTTVSAETRYAYRVVALNANGASPRSGYVNVTTGDAP